jgi:hypothetical protein
MLTFSKKNVLGGDGILPPTTQNSFGPEWPKHQNDKIVKIGDCLKCLLFFCHLYVDIIKGLLGKGGYGEVYLCVKSERLESTNSIYETKKYAIKKMKFPQNNLSAQSEKEIGLIGRFNSRYLIQYDEIFTIGDAEYAVMKYFEKGDLLKFISKYRIEQKKIPSEVFISFLFFSSNYRKQWKYSQIC